MTIVISLDKQYSKRIEWAKLIFFFIFLLFFSQSLRSNPHFFSSSVRVISREKSYCVKKSVSFFRQTVTNSRPIILQKRLDKMNIAVTVIKQSGNVVSLRQAIANKGYQSINQSQAKQCHILKWKIFRSLENSDFRNVCVEQ